jgi:hypothetical protein
MIRLYVLAALATLSVPVLMPQQFLPSAFPSGWVLFFVLAEIVLSAALLKLIYPKNDAIRCATFGLGFFAVRFVLCLLGSLADPDADVLWSSVEYRWTAALVPTLNYMYAVWYVSGVQYLSLFLWLPGVLELAFPGIFPPRMFPAAAAPAGETPAKPKPRIVLKPPDQPITFADLEREMEKYPGLLGWIVFSPDKLPVWRAGDDTADLEQAPDVLRRLGELAQPLLRPEWGREVSQSMFQTKQGYCILTTLSGGFLFGSLWQVGGSGMPTKKVLQEVLDRMERWLTYRFLESPAPTRSG